MSRVLNVLHCEGICPDSLGHYLTGLGLLAVAARQWPEMRGCWQKGHFILVGKDLDRTYIESYLLKDWEPTPYERWWSERQKKDTKASSDRHIQQARNQEENVRIRLLDSHIVCAGRNQFNRVLGSGGNVGRRDLSKVFKDAQVLVRDRTAPQVLNWLRATLFGNSEASLPDLNSAGTWFVYANKTFNSGQDWYREGQLSPWSFLLALEGALLLVLKDLNIFPQRGEEQQAFEIDELETGYPRMTLLQLIDVAGVFTEIAANSKEEKSKGKSTEAGELPRAFNLVSPELRGKEQSIKQRAAAAQAPGNVISWRGLLGKLWRVQRLQVFDNSKALRLDHASLLQPGSISVIDLSDTDSPQVNNLVIADLLRGALKQQEENARAAEAAKKRPTPVVIIIEKAHEFLSAQRISQMPVLFQQVAKIAKRGRKRWLGLVFVTQLPQHLPDEVLGLINNFILHKIADSGVVDRLRKSISGIDKGQWSLVPGLAPGQAMVSLTSMTRPLLVSIDPTPCKLKLVE